MKNKEKEFGKHYLIEFIDCDPDKLKYVKEVEDIFIRAAQKSGATILNYYFHQFKTCGVSGVILIAESHFSIHTWPEDCYAAGDIHTCGEMYPEKAIEVMKDAFRSKRVKVQIISRGF